MIIIPTAEAVELLKRSYEEKKSTYEYMIEFGNQSERVLASVVKHIALGKIV